MNIIELNRHGKTIVMRGWWKEYVSFNRELQAVAVYKDEGYPVAKIFYEGRRALDYIEKIEAFRQAQEFSEKVNRYKPNAEKWTVTACHRDKLEDLPT
jgi:UDP-N-acetylglucosamine 2-epimerase